MSAKDDNIAELEKKYVAFRDHFVPLEDEAYREVWLGEWDANHLLAHMAGWYREMAGAFKRVGEGLRPAPDGVDFSDSDAWNVKFAALAKDGQAALDDFDNAFHEYYAAAKALPESLFGIDPEKNRPLMGTRLLQGAGLSHFDEHQAQVEEWLGARA